MIRNSLRVVLLNQQTADETTSQPVDVSGFSSIVFYLMGQGGTISSGSITYEEATTDPAHSEQTYGGTWSIIGTAVNATDVTGDKSKATHPARGAYHVVRARIDTAIGGGGNVSVVLVASV